MFGALEVGTGRWVYRLGRRHAAGFVALLHLLHLLVQAVPQAPAIVVICDNDSIHHARAVTAFLREHPRVEVLYGGTLQPARQPGGADLGGVEELRGQHRRGLAGPPETDPHLLPRPLTRPTVDHRRALDQPLAGCHPVTNRTSGMPLRAPGK
ncbi:hypothetical protein PA7_20000 [Pseudonocardia asaccharolytica DSM 44247 = NBRC 16224]|uniref:Tc1-like transposase DDE domain-containing protein n=1 Tax=Pseudonocardia asaccharolytica DSM 44247 = NBRC 16224 TaxID=1123024 RepID=A0A511D0V3_9PSEU|nr:hypothetical protein PA7_20000 [Pseudonocardia asaccharolytica DSM 44247 = NBRC 16224]